jgi:PAS domain S-box-containing protein
MTAPAQTEDLLRRLVQQEDEHAIILLDQNGDVVAWLGAAEKVFGRTADEMRGQSTSILFAPEDIAKGMPEHELEVAEKNGHAEDDRWMLRSDKHRFWATGIMMPIRADDGTILGFSKILRDRTDVKEQLESSQRLIEQSQKVNESKDIFIATLAHELRNPLASIATAAAILDHTGASNEDCRFARATIQRQLGHIQRMIEDLLEVTKADVGKIRLDKRETSLNEIVRAAVESCRPAIEKGQHTLQLLMTERPITVSADPPRLQQVFVNLLENAAKYTSHGGHIWVKVSVEGHEGVVKVEDTGIGISAEIMPRIFDLFTQADLTSSRRGSGLGIGLSLVKDLINLHGGTVQVKSDGVGKGSEFTVRLPLAGSDASRPNSPDPAGRRNA